MGDGFNYSFLTWYQEEACMVIPSMLWHTRDLVPLASHSSFHQKFMQDVRVQVDRSHWNPVTKMFIMPQDNLMADFFLDGSAGDNEYFQVEVDLMELHKIVADMASLAGSGPVVQPMVDHLPDVLIEENSISTLGMRQMVFTHRSKVDYTWRLEEAGRWILIIQELPRL
mgnify:CR=1 FL=1